MKKGFIIGLYFILNILFVPLFAQEEAGAIIEGDTIQQFRRSALVPVDTFPKLDVGAINKEMNLKVVDDFQPNPTKAVLYSAIFPGLGQIYNRKYWKLPIVYGGFLGVVYAVTWNGNLHTDYKNAYMDIMLDYENKTRWHNFVSNPEKVRNDPGQLEAARSSLKRRRDYFRRNRDLAIIVGVGLYALCMIDAYVDAQLYNFNISPDLSMTMAPTIWGPSQSSNSVAFGFQCNIVF